MKALGRRFDLIVTQAAEVEKYVKQSDRELENKVAQNLLDRSGSLFPIGLLGYLFGILGFLFSLKEKPGTELFYPQTISWIFLLCGLLTVAVSISVHLLDCSKNKQLKEVKQRELEAERAGDPLFARARLIMSAVRDYGIHCNRYRSWRVSLNEELNDSDRQKADEYYSFLVRSNTAIDKAIDNFLSAAELKQKILDYDMAHPGSKSISSGTALSELVALLDEPIDEPDLDPIAALLHEENIADLNVGLREAELSAKIAALPEHIEEEKKIA